jgi:hypothetical protein
MWECLHRHLHLRNQRGEEISVKGNARVDGKMADIGNLRAFDRGRLSKLLTKGEGRF